MGDENIFSHRFTDGRRVLWQSAKSAGEKWLVPLPPHKWDGNEWVMKIIFPADFTDGRRGLWQSTNSAGEKRVGPLLPMNG